MVIEEDVAAKQKVCEQDLKAAEPALIAAQEALNTLNKVSTQESLRASIISRVYKLFHQPLFHF